MSEQGQFQQAMRLGEELGWFVEMVPVSKNGIDYEVPSVFWDDFVALQAENAELRQDAKALARAFQKCRNGKAFITPDCLDKYLTVQGEG